MERCWVSLSLPPSLLGGIWQSLEGRIARFSAPDRAPDRGTVRWLSVRCKGALGREQQRRRRHRTNVPGRHRTCTVPGRFVRWQTLGEAARCRRHRTEHRTEDLSGGILFGGGERSVALARGRESAPDSCPVLRTFVRCSAGARGEVSRPLETDGRSLKEGHVDGQEAPNRVPPDKSFVRCFVRCMRRKPSEGVTALFGFEAINRGELGLG